MVERSDLPLFAPAQHRCEALHAVRLRRHLVAGCGMLLGLDCGALIATIVLPPRPILVWNASASAPLGLYRIAAPAPIGHGDLVIARTPFGVRDLAAQRGYIPANVPLVKRVAGIAGDRICAIGAHISVNGRPLATRQATDRRGRPMPWWRGCRALRQSEVLLLMAETPDSFDGRYFGPISAGGVIGKARLLWAR